MANTSADSPAVAASNPLNQNPSDRNQPENPVPRSCTRQPNAATKKGIMAHGSRSWMGCYNDHCQIHLAAKERSGWFPKKHGKKHAGNRKAKHQKDRDVKEALQELTAELYPGGIPTSEDR